MQNHLRMLFDCEDLSGAAKFDYTMSGMLAAYLGRDRE